MNEKYFVNSDCLQAKQIVDHLTGLLERIPVGGDFRNASISVYLG